MASSTARTRVGVLAAVLGLALSGATTATAAASDSETALSARFAPTAVQVVHPSLACNTTFVPSAPHGAPMDQYWNNCGTSTKTVCPALITSSGTTVYSAKWATVAPGYVAHWYYSSTVKTGQYTTVYCQPV